MWEDHGLGSCEKITGTIACPGLVKIEGPVTRIPSQKIFMLACCYFRVNKGPSIHQPMGKGRHTDTLIDVDSYELMGL